MAERYGEEFVAYRCRVGHWHVGRRRVPRVPRFITREEALDHPQTLVRLEAKDRRRHLLAMAAMQPRRLP
jgi:hypothetical protein